MSTPISAPVTTTTVGPDGHYGAGSVVVATDPAGACSQALDDEFGRAFDLYWGMHALQSDRYDHDLERMGAWG